MIKNKIKILITGREDSVDQTVILFSFLEKKFGTFVDCTLETAVQADSALYLIKNQPWLHTLIITDITSETSLIADKLRMLKKRVCEGGPLTPIILMLEPHQSASGPFGGFSPKIVHKPLDWKTLQEIFPDIIRPQSSVIPFSRGTKAV